jgi:hypothetical protein
MSTRTLYVTCNARPVRLALLVDNPDPATLEHVFRINTLLWGGRLNPIVVLDGTTRKQVGVHYAYETLPYEQEVLLLLKEFDPDILINYSNSSLPLSLAPFKERIFPPERLRWNPWGQQEIMYFVEVWPFLERYWRREFRFLQKPNEKYGYIDLAPPGQQMTYLIARFGSYPDGHNGNSVLATNFAGKLVTYNEAFRKSFALGEWVFPIGITTLQLDIRSPATFGGYIFFLLNPQNMFEIVDYWNLRASGYRVFPLPIGHYQDFADSAKAFAERSIYPINRNVMNSPEVVKGRSVEDSQLDDAGAWIRSLDVKAEMLSLKGWVPRFGERGDRVSPEIEVRPTISKESSEIVVLNNGYGTLQGPVPDCEFQGPSFSQHWATELQLSASGDEERTFRLPWLHPGCDMLVNQNVGHGLGPDAARVSKQGIVVIRRGDRESIWIQEPKVTEVLQGYLKDGGFKYLKTSSPGLALERIIEQMGGLLSCGVFQNSGVREIIEELADGSAMNAETVRKMIHRTLSVSQDERQQTFEAVLRKLISTKILRQGLQLQCDRCQRHDWYHLTDLGEDFKCRKCFHIQPVPLLDKRPWYYISDGLFRLEGKVAGCLTTVLSLLFLRVFLEHGMRYTSSFEYTDGSDAAERDFAVFATELLQDDVDVIIGECKTSKELEDKEKNDIEQLGARTGAYLAFSKLSREFTEGDKLFFERLVTSGQKPILLTRKHLEMSYLEVSKYGVEKHWGGRHAELASRLTIREVLGDEFADKLRLWT